MQSINLPSILTPDAGLLFWMLLAFLVVFFFVAKFGFPVIIKMVEERKNYIDEALGKAREAKQKLADIQNETDPILKKSMHFEKIAKLWQTSPSLLQKKWCDSTLPTKLLNNNSSKNSWTKVSKRTEHRLKNLKTIWKRTTSLTDD